MCIGNSSPENGAETLRRTAAPKRIQFLLQRLGAVFRVGEQVAVAGGAAAAAKEAEAKAVQIVAADTLAEVRSEANAGVLIFDQPAVVSIDHGDGPTIKLGEICARLGFTVTADFLASLGLHPVATEKNAKLYSESKFPIICRKIIEHVGGVMQRPLGGKAA